MKTFAFFSSKEQSNGVLPTVIALAVMLVCTFLFLTVFFVYKRIWMEKKRKKERGILFFIV